MKLLVYFHDAALAHSRYLLEAFSQNKSVSSLTVAYPEGRGEDVIFSAGGSGGVPEAHGYRLVPLKSSLLRPKWASFAALFHLVRHEQPDYVVVLDEALYPNTLSLGLIVRILGLQAPVVCYGFENISQTPPWGWLRQNGWRVLGPFARKAFRYWCFDIALQPLRKRVVSGALVSYCDCESVIRRIGWMLPIREQWWGVDTQLFRKASNLKNGRPALWAIEDSRIVIGYVGRFVPEKGILDLIHSLTLLGEDYVLVCIGSGPQELLIAETAARLGVSSRLRLLTPMPPCELANHIAALSVLALPSHTETFWKEQYGRVLVEAMAAGVPVVGSRSGAIPYVISDESRVFDEGDVAGIAAAIRIAVKMPPKDRLLMQDRARRGDVGQFVQALVDFAHDLGVRH